MPHANLMFFAHWWQGVLFGIYTTVFMALVGYIFAGMWDRYEEKPQPVRYPTGRED